VVALTVAVAGDSGAVQRSFDETVIVFTRRTRRRRSTAIGHITVLTVLWTRCTQNTRHQWKPVTLVTGIFAPEQERSSYSASWWGGSPFPTTLSAPLLI